MPSSSVPGISGGWVAKELCERGLKTLLIERGRNVNHRKDYLDFSAPWDVPHRGMVPEAEAAEHYAIQSQCYAFNSATKQWWVRDSEHPYSHAGGSALRVDARLSPGRPLDHVGPPDLSHERFRFRRQPQGRPWHRLADSIRRHFAVVRPRRNVRRNFRRERRTRAIAGWAVPAADGAQLRRNGIQEADRRGISDSPRDGRALRAPDRAHAPNTSRSAAGPASCAAPASAAVVMAPISPRCRRRCRRRRRPATSRSSPTRSWSVSTTTTRSAVFPACGSSTRIRGTARSYQARVVFVCASTIGDGADPALVALGVFSARPREPFRRGGPLPHGSRDGYRRSGHLSGISRSLLLRPQARPASTCRGTSTSPKKPTSISCAGLASRDIRGAAPGGAGNTKSESASSSSNVCAIPGVGRCSSWASVKCCRGPTTA